MSDIKVFRVNVVRKDNGFNWDETKKEICRQFDEWREKENPRILAINFGRKHGVYIEEDPHYYFIEALFDL